MSATDADVRAFALAAIATRASASSSPRAKKAAVVSTGDLRRHDIRERLAARLGVEWSLARLTEALEVLVARGAMRATGTGGYRVGSWERMAEVVTA
jgi:hypothetical protein